MHLRVIDVHGTPEEIAALPQLAELLGTKLKVEHPAAMVDAPVPATPDALPAHVLSVLEFRRPAGEVHRLIISFLAEALSWPDVEARVGVSRRSQDGRANAIRLHVRGSAVGAFVYLRLPAGTILVRLPSNFVERDLVHARPRQVSAEAPYGLALKIGSEAALAEAEELARIACERARGGVTSNPDAVDDELDDI
jgi:hypothetical protein